MVTCVYTPLAHVPPPALPQIPSRDLVLAAWNRLQQSVAASQAPSASSASQLPAAGACASLEPQEQPRSGLGQGLGQGLGLGQNLALGGTAAP